jgi:hypothetical protein
MKRKYIRVTEYHGKYPLAKFLLAFVILVIVALTGFYYGINLMNSIFE